MSSAVSYTSRRPAADLPVLALALAALAGVASALAAAGSWRMIGVLATTAVLGWVFLAYGFGYTGAFRVWLMRRDGAGLAAGILVALVAAAVVIPVCALVPGYGGYTAPIGLPLLLGAAMFGMGMQLANGCGSGTLYAFGGGSPRMLVALPALCLGGLLGTLILPAAASWPGLPEVSLPGHLGPWAGLGLTWLLGLALIAAVVGRGPRPSAAQLRVAAGIGALAAVVFLCAGQPWGVTSGLTLWGAKAAAALGFDVAHAEYWTWDGPKQSLVASVLAQPSSVMDIGMILGATAASARRRQFRAQSWPPVRGLIGAAAGGLLMGIGARLSFGCNIGALVGGIASGSLHGFVWFLAVLPGCWLGIRLRPWCGLSAR